MLPISWLLTEDDNVLIYIAKHYTLFYIIILHLMSSHFILYYIIFSLINQPVSLHTCLAGLLIGDDSTILTNNPTTVEKRAIAIAIAITNALLLVLL